MSRYSTTGFNLDGRTDRHSLLVHGLGKPTYNFKKSLLQAFPEIEDDLIGFSVTDPEPEEQEWYEGVWKDIRIVPDAYEFDVENRSVKIYEVEISGILSRNPIKKDKLIRLWDEVLAESGIQMCVVLVDEYGNHREIWY